LKKEQTIYNVKYVGKAPWKLVEFNGKRYYFSHKNPFKKMPEKVFRYITSNRTGHEEDFIVTETTMKQSEIKKDVKETSKSIEDKQNTSTMVHEKPNVMSKKYKKG